jgi:hypothetical protein
MILLFISTVKDVKDVADALKLTKIIVPLPLLICFCA